MGIGYNLTQNKIPLVYFQNSGLSNAINPLISIADKNIYSIPMLLIIGWRGSPKSNDEPQHKRKGEITRKILSLMKIKNIVEKISNNILILLNHYFFFQAKSLNADCKNFGTCSLIICIFLS